MAIIKAYKGKAPRLDRPAFLAETAVLAGDVALASQTSVFYGAVLRADSGSITVGEGTNIQDGAVVHTGTDQDVRIGRNVTVGHCALVHGCTVGDGALIGMHATVMKGAGALVTENFVLPPRTVAVGVPAKICGKVRPQAAAELEADAAFYRDCAREHAAQPLLPAD